MNKKLTHLFWQSDKLIISQEENTEGLGAFQHTQRILQMKWGWGDSYPWAQVEGIQ